MPGLSGFRDNETGHARANVVTPPPTLVKLVTIGSLATHQILAQLDTRILRYGDGGARAHVQRCPTPPMTCGKHVLSDFQLEPFSGVEIHMEMDMDWKWMEMGHNL